MVFPRRSARSSFDNLSGPGYAAGSSRGRGTDSLAEAGAPRDARDDGGLLLRMDAVALPDLDSGVLFRELSSEPSGIGPVFGGRAFGGRDRRRPGRAAERPAAAQNAQSGVRAVRGDRGRLSGRVCVSDSGGAGS